MTILSTLLLIAAQTSAHAHLHVEVDELAWLDCTPCVLAKNSLTPAADAAPGLYLRTGTAVLPGFPPSWSFSTAARFQPQARAPPGAAGAA